MDVTPGKFRRAVYCTLCLSFPGLLAVTSALVGFKAALEIVGLMPVPIIAGYLAMGFVIERVAVPHRIHFHDFRVGVPFAVLLLISGLFTGSAVSLLLNPSVELFLYVIWVIVLGCLFGALPAAVLGIIGTCILRKVRNGIPTGELHLKRP